MSPVTAQALEPVRLQTCSELTNSYRQVLQQPKDWAAFQELATVQLRLALPSRAKYTLQRANPETPKDAANVELLRGVMASMLGDPATARMHYETAKQRNAAVDNIQNLQTMRIDPKLVQELRAPRLPSITVRCAVTAARTEDNQLQVTVHATNAQQVPVADAKVTLVGQGGFFSDTKAAQISGRTDARGRFMARWSYTVRTRRPVFKIQVSRPGYQTTTTDSLAAAVRQVPATPAPGAARPAPAPGTSAVPGAGARRRAPPAPDTSPRAVPAPASEPR
jgi:hypothetical protein